VPPALQFAERYPARTTALALLSGAPYTPLGAQQELPVPSWVYEALFRTDFPFWLLYKLAPTSLDGIFDVTPQLRAQLNVEEARMVASTIDGFLPVSRRVHGVRNEGAAIKGAAIEPTARYRIEEIAIPTLVVHAQDDRINPFTYGEYTATRIPGARFMALETGGHLLLGHQAKVRDNVNLFLRKRTDAHMSSAIQ
jgi:pimeloyl-ACP methyl ester carboxylesterase